MNTDQFQPFLFDELAIRGQIVHLDSAFLDCMERQHYPEKIKKHLGEFLTAVSLLSSSIKFDGSLVLQAQGKGQVSLMMAECKNRESIRGICRYSDAFDREKLLFENANLALTLEPSKGQPYQSFIALHEDDLQHGLEDYFLQSEQIRTLVHLSVNENRAAGMIIQAMPTSDFQGSLQQDDESFTRIEALFRTLSDEELLSLSNEELLFRLFHEEIVRVFDSKPINFICGCSRVRCIAAVQNLGQQDAKALIAEEGEISVDCQFCKQHYSFKDVDLVEIFRLN